MDLNEFLKNPDNKSFEVDIGISLLRIVEMTCRNQIYLRSILKRQLEIKEILNGKTESEFDESVKDKLFELETKILDLSKEKYHKLLEKILK